MFTVLSKTASRQCGLRLLASMPCMLLNELTKKIIASFLSVKAILGSERRTVAGRFHDLGFEKSLATFDRFYVICDYVVQLWWSTKCCTVLLSTIIAASIKPAGIYSALLYNRVSCTSIGA